VKKPVEYFLLY
jgi:hypothetical protein